MFTTNCEWRVNESLSFIENKVIDTKRGIKVSWHESNIDALTESFDKLQELLSYGEDFVRSLIDSGKEALSVQRYV